MGRVDSAGEEAGSFLVTCRSQAATLELKRLPCVFEVEDEQGKQQFAGVAWSAVVRCESTDSVLQRRYWIASGEQGVAPLLRIHLTTDGYASLTRHALQTLDEMPGFRDCHDLRVQVASSLAATALRIDLSSEQRDLELRDQLMALLGGKRACTAKSLVDALSYLFIARELLVPSRMN